MTFKEFSHPEDLVHDIPKIQQLIQKEIDAYKTEKRYIRKDGGIIWCSLSVTAMFDKNGEFLYTLGVLEDITARKHAENEIRRLSDRIATATKSAQVGIWDWDVKNNLLSWDDQMYLLYGIEKDHFKGAYDAWVNGLHPDDRDFSQIQTQLALKGEKEYDTEFRVVWPDGTLRYLRAKGEVFRNDQGEAVRMIGINFDSTKEKALIDKVRAKDMEFRKLSANVPGMIYQFTRKPDGSYNVPISSEGIQTIFGCKPEDVVSDFSPISKVLYSSDAKRVIRDIEYSAKHLTKFTCEFRVQIPGRDIQWIYSSSTPERLPDGSITWYGFNTDITEKKLVEVAIRESEKKFRELIESIPLPLVYSNNEGKLLFRNERFSTVFGYSEADIRDIQDWWMRAYPDESYRTWVIQNWNAAVARAKEHGTDIETDEYLVTCKDLSKKTVIISGIILGENLLATMIDISDQKLIEEQLNHLNETLEQRVIERTSQLEAANKELEAFSYSVSHDLRAPLRHINGFVELLVERFQENLPEKAQQYLATIADSAKQMGTLIDDLLQFSRTGRQELRQTRFDMTHLVQEVVEKIGQDLSQRDIKWQLNPLPEVNGDYTLLKQVWVNLIENAAKYTRLCKISEIQIDCIEEQEFYVFSIKDNGVGFDMKYAHKLFGVFQRLHSQSEFEGTGVGLANVKRIVNKHKGSVWVEAVPDQGATFFFSLPKKQDKHNDGIEDHSSGRG